MFLKETNVTAKTQTKAQKAWDQRLVTARNVRSIESLCSPFLMVWLLADMYEFTFSIKIDEWYDPATE